MSESFLAVLMAIQKWRHYLQGRKFTIKTDQQSLKYLLDQKIVTPMQQKWITKLLGLDYDIQYKKKKGENKAADALSRMGYSEEECTATTTLIPKWTEQIHQSYIGDSFIQTILDSKSADASRYLEFHLEGGVLRYKGKIVVGNAFNFRMLILHEMHSSLYGGHSGVLGTYMRLKRVFFWPNMKLDVTNWVKKCDICAKCKPTNGTYPGLLQPLSVLAQAWTHISMDFIEGLPKSWGKNVILVVVDRLTKYAHFIALSHLFTAQTVAKAFLDVIYKLHGIPTTIVTDRDKIFTSSFWKKLFTLMGTQLAMSTTYHPQTDGQTKRLNRCLEHYLRCMVHTNPKQWLKWLPLAEYWYNTNHHSSLKLSPFQALYGYPPPNLSLGPYLDTPETDATRLLHERQKATNTLRDDLFQAQERMEFYADKHRQERTFSVGDWVYLVKTLSTCDEILS